MADHELDEIMEKVDCRYTLVVEIAKRARQLVDGAQPLTEKSEENPVTQAIEEVCEDKISYIRPQQ